jgi:hypothetical protein
MSFAVVISRKRVALAGVSLAAAAVGAVVVVLACSARGPAAVAPSPGRSDAVPPTIFGTTDGRYDPGASTWIRGRVVHAGRPVAGAVVEWVRGDADTYDRYTTWTRPDGTFALQLRGPRRGWIRAQRGAMTARRRHVHLNEPFDADHVVLAIGRAQRVAGVVFDERGEPLVGAKVGIQDAFAMPGDPVTDPDGRFGFDRGLEPGRYDLTVFWHGVPLARSAGSIGSVEVPDDDRALTPVRLVEQRRYPGITGTVVDLHGAPVTGAMVELFPGGWTHTDVTGHFELWSRDRRRFGILATGDGHRTAAADGVAMGTHGLRLVIRPGGAVRVHCGHLKAGGPVLALHHGARFYPVWCGQRVDGIPPGVYRADSEDRRLVGDPGAVVVRRGRVAELGVVPR